jgi:hypothetical protein
VVERYDLFRLDKDSSLWIGTAETMQEAYDAARKLENCPECLVLDSVTGEKIVLKAGRSASQ